MRYSLEPKYRKCVESYGCLLFSRKFGDKCGKNLVDTARKTGMDTAKTASKRVAYKTTEATADLNGNKVADKITSSGKTKSKQDESNKRQEIYTTRKKTVNYRWFKI